MRPANQPTITSVSLRHKKIGDPLCKQWDINPLSKPQDFNRSRAERYLNPLCKTLKLNPLFKSWNLNPLCKVRNLNPKCTARNLNSKYKARNLNPKRQARKVSFWIIRLNNDKWVKQADYLSISEVLFLYEEMNIYASFGQVFYASSKTDCTVGRQYLCHPDSEEHSRYYVITFRLCASVYILIRFNSCAIAWRA